MFIGGVPMRANGITGTLTAALVVAAAVGIAPAPAAAQSLDDALIRAYTENPRLRAERARLRSVDEQLPQALSNWRPTVIVNGSAGVATSDRDSPTGNTTDDTTPVSADITLSQPVFRGFRTRAETRRANANIAAARADLLSTEQQVLFDVVTAHADVVREQAVLDLNINNERVLERQLEATQDRFDVGELTRTDVAQAEARLARAISDRIDAEDSLANAIADYKAVVGIEPVNPQPASEPADLLPNNRTTAISTAIANNPDVIAAEFREQSATDDVDLITGELLPSVTVDATASRQDEVSGSNIEQDRASLTANLRVPLYQSGSVSSRVRQAKQIASQRLLELIDARREAERAAGDAWESLAASRGRVVSFTSQVRAQEIALEGVTQEQQVGSRTILDVLDAEQELLDARVGLVRAQRDTVFDSHDLLTTLGRLTAEDLALPVEIYDFNTNFDAVRGRIFGTDIRSE